MSTNEYIFIEKNIPVETLLTDFFKSNNKYKTIHPIQSNSDDQEIVVKWGADCATIMDISKRDDYIESNIHPTKVFI